MANTPGGVSREIRRRRISLDTPLGVFVVVSRRMLSTALVERNPAGRDFSGQARAPPGLSGQVLSSALVERAFESPPVSGQVLSSALVERTFI